MRTIELVDGKPSLPIVQGGMGAGISGARLSGTVASLGGVGVVSLVALRTIVDVTTGRKLDHEKAAACVIRESVERSKGRGLIGANALIRMPSSTPSIRGAVYGGADLIFAGAGLPLDLPEIVEAAERERGRKVGLVPIVSSARALKIICERWKRHNRRPAAVVLEGPLAGGHLGFKPEEIENPEYQLEKLFPPLLETSQEYGDFPVIVAGGIWDHTDISRWLDAGATAVQMGTRFLATWESGASPEFKGAVVAAMPDDITLATPGSPSGLPFRVLRSSPGIVAAQAGNQVKGCPYHYMVPDEAICPAKSDPKKAFCICRGLLGACGGSNDAPAWTVGVNASRVTRIMYTSELMAELSG